MMDRVFSLPTAGAPKIAQDGAEVVWEDDGSALCADIAYKRICAGVRYARASFGKPTSLRTCFLP
jgi:hypothetical protein